MITLSERIAHPVRAGRRAVIRAMPASRRIRGLGGAKGRGWLQARKLTAPFLQRPVTLTTPTGLRLRLSADRVDEHIAQLLLGPRRVEHFPPLREPVPEGACILDIGAHHGLYAAAALHEYPGSRIICVEPSAGALDALRTNLEINGYLHRARVVNVALASENGQGLLRHTPDGTWGYSLYEEPSVALGSETVTLSTLDRILDGAQPQILKCNAEGAEFSLVDELERTGVRPLFMSVMVHPHFGDMALLVSKAESMSYDVVQLGTDDRPTLHMWRDTKKGQRGA